MNSIEIIEDCSPYYVRFKHRSICNIIDICSQFNEVIPYKKLEIINLSKDVIDNISVHLPYPEPYNNISKTMSLFVTGSKFYMRAHKDEPDVSTAINYTILNVDDQCVTSWYDSLEEYKINYINKGKIRDVVGFKKCNHSPSAKLVAVAGEGVLVNQEIFHDFDNSTSENVRTILHIKLDLPYLDFETHKKILFSDNRVNI